MAAVTSLLLAISATVIGIGLIAYGVRRAPRLKGRDER